VQLALSLSPRVNAAVAAVAVVLSLTIVAAKSSVYPSTAR
jgi:hypothetical protein